MRWREVIVGAIVTLLVTIVGGISVWFLTREQAPKWDGEKLVYNVDALGDFDLSTGRLGIFTIKAANIGNRAARDVRLTVNFPKSVQIKEKKIDFSSGPAAQFDEISDKPNALGIYIKSFAPNEAVKILLILNGDSGFDPEIGIRSSETVAEIQSTQSGSLVYGVRGTKSWLVTVCVMAAQAMIYMFPLGLARKMHRRVSTWMRSANNTAFLYIHSGLIEEAREMLDQSIRKKGADIYLLANEALAVGLTGDLEGAEKRFRAAEWWQCGRHEHALIYFNRSILCISNSDYDNANLYLNKALELSPKEIKKYCMLSNFIHQAVRSNHLIRDSIEKVCPKHEAIKYLSHAV